MGLGVDGKGAAASPPNRFDIWAEGAFSYYSNDRIDAKRQGQTGLLFAGADYVGRPEEFFPQKKRSKR